MRIDVVTTTARPELSDLCRGLVAWQRVGGCEIVHHVDETKPTKRKDDKFQCLADLVERTDGDFIYISDDDDYFPPGYLARCMKKIGVKKLYGEIPARSYLFGPRPAYGESTARRDLFHTFTLYRASLRPMLVTCLREMRMGDMLHGDWTHSDKLIVVRGLMSDPSTAITARKNQYNAKNWPHEDPGNAKFREWLQDDPLALAAYLTADRKARAA